MDGTLMRAIEHSRTLCLFSFVFVDLSMMMTVYIVMVNQSFNLLQGGKIDTFTTGKQRRNRGKAMFFLGIMMPILRDRTNHIPPTASDIHGCVGSRKIGMERRGWKW